ncbi:hypothetical protein GRX03_02355 [Halovenus sp. WSH3]|uniref:Uncharacterized protein n=1 Tax=Halovenus carboxidivorans TaxID=2692199 RepID=A0A6B0SXJ5_9EURY|nr:hypothetical protein [Halovenus carboxidivorans]MXR50448.1 hypothetical protein [Halovenus carboxidivorans]
MTLDSSLRQLPDDKRRQLINWFDDQYQLTKVDRPALPFGTDSAAGVDVFCCWPPAAFKTVVPAFTDSPLSVGENTAKLIRWLDATDQPWALQLLSQPYSSDPNIHSMHQDESCLRLNIRCAIQTKVISLDAGTVKPEVGQPPKDTRLRTDQNLPVDSEGTRTNRSEMLNRLVNKQINPDTAFGAPDSYSRGVLFPPQIVSSLEHGVGNVNSSLTRAAPEEIRDLLSPTLSVGRMELSAINGTMAPVGLSDPGIVLKINASRREALRTAQESLQSHLSLNSPTFVVASNTELLEYFGRIYCSLINSAAEFDITYLGSAELERLCGCEQAQRRAVLKSWLANESDVYLVDIPGESGWPTDPALYEDLQAVRREKTDGIQGATVDAIFAELPVLSGDQPMSGVAAAAIAAAKSGTTYLTVQTAPADRAGDGSSRNLSDSSEATQSCHTAAKLVNRSDLALVSTDGAVAQLCQQYTGEQPQDYFIETFFPKQNRSADGPWIGVKDNLRFDSAPIVGPVYRSKTMQDVTYNIKVPPQRYDQLKSVLSVPTASAETDDGPQTAGGEASGTDDQPATAGITTRHAIRRPDDLAVVYDAGQAGYVCEQCRATTGIDASVYERSLTGLMSAVTCCQSLAEIDRDVLRCTPDVELGSTQVDPAEGELTAKELEFLSMIYLAQRGELDCSLEYDPLVDSCVKLRKDVGIDSQTETELADAGYIVRMRAPQKVYSLTTKGLNALGVDKSALQDLPSLFERCLQRAVWLSLKTKYDAKSGYDVETNVMCDVAATISSMPSQSPLDVAVIGPDGNITTGAVVWPPVVDLGTVPEDNNSVDALSFDYLTGYDGIETAVKYQTLVSEVSDTALWCVWRQADATALLSTLSAADDDSVIDCKAGYSDNVRIQDYQLDEPGITDVKTMKQMRDATNPRWTVDEDRGALQLQGEDDAWTRS